MARAYGGLVIGGVAEKVPKRIRASVYLDAYIPKDNKSAFDLIPGLETIYKKMALSGQGKEWLVASYEPREFGVTNTNDIKWMSTKLTPMPWHTHDQRIRINNPEAKKILKGFICCSEFGVSQFKRAKSSRQSGTIMN